LFRAGLVEKEAVQPLLADARPALIIHPAASVVEMGTQITQI